MLGKTCNIPTSCLCDSKFNIQHSMSYKKGGIICIRHNDLQEQAANILSEVSKDTEAEAKLKPLSGEELQDRTSNNSNKERERAQQAFFDLWVFDPNACRYRKKSLQQCYVMNKQETSLQ